AAKLEADGLQYEGMAKPYTELLVSGGPPFALQALVEALEAADPGVRAAAVRVLALRTDLDAATRSEASAKALADADYSVRRATLSLPLPERPAAELLTVVRQALADRDDEARRQAAEVAGKMGPAAAEVAADLRKRLTDRDRLVRVLAAEALCLSGKPTDEAVAVLRQALTCPGDPGRAPAAEVFRRMGGGVEGAARL